ncbi:FAD-binding oxidoreductase [Cellulosimicrobium protaetiae]|uniref:FAD-binding oxidoreductase n=1 Tax=Cellulosimicrobium protaetiae TaxID=2587808 RepID=A0A6M5U949_9MICO|nr:FAD-binding oxidoreductase [Cellulosimicrobium protaetiae]QJW35027.1 FAD-binding oxidoreductase [Cellulosimicrobium protaetiae]
MTTSATTLPPTEVAALRDRVAGRVLARGDLPDGGPTAAEVVAAHSTLVTHDPDIAVLAATEADVVEAVRFAALHGLQVRAHATGHGAASPIADGLVLGTGDLAGVEVDPETRIARISAGTRWKAVVEAGAAHGLAPVTGSSTGVGVVGYTLGGGFGPLTRSHGLTTDWVRGFRVVLADGSVVEANPVDEPELYWALRGGKGGLGVVTRVDVELVPLRTLYAGALTFDAPHIEDVLRGWVDWTATAPDDVTTSVVILALPDLPFLPEHLRGRTVLNLRFAYPGDATEGERLAAPLRELAPVLADAVGEIPAAAVGSIHADPEDPGPSWVFGAGLRAVDGEFLDRFLADLGPGSGAPFLGLELRHVGAAGARDVDGGSAAGGRTAGFLVTLLGLDPSRVPDMIDAAAAFSRWSQPWAATETNINFLPGPWTDETLARAWSPETAARLASARSAYDPAGLFAWRV